MPHFLVRIGYPDFVIAKELCIKSLHHYLNCLAERGDIPCEHTNLLAHFLWAGQLAVVSDETVPMGERIEFMKKMIGRLVI